eukprot:scaffold6936_cov76-Phaeocystis_antarctica.AAC.1
MAIPSLAAMAALTLLQNTHMQPEDVSVDYTPYAAPATVLQRWWRRRGVLNRAATRINALMRAFSVRCFISCQPGFMNTRDGVSDFLMHGFQPGNLMLSYWAGVRDRLISPRDMRSGRRYLARRRALAQRQETRVFIGRRADNLYVFHVDR